jgi:serine/threonine-protein kinase
LFWQAADGTGTLERLLETPSNPAPFGWSPDGSLIFDELAPQLRNIRILKMSGDRTATTLLGTEFSERRPALSPDGRWLAYESDESGQYEVYVRPFPAVNDGKWQVSRGGGSEPSWSPRGDELYYLSSESLVALPVQPGTTFTFGSPTPLIPRSGYQFPNQARDYAVAPDGRFLLLKAPPSEGAGTRAVPLHLVLVENWFEELRQRVPTGN